MLKSKDKSPSVEAAEHHDNKTRNYIVIFDFHHCCIQIYNVKNHEVLTTDVLTKHAKEGGKYKTYLEEYYVGGFLTENYPPIKGGKGILDDIPEKSIKEEIMEFFKTSISLIKSHIDDIRQLIIVCEFKHFPLRRYFNSTMKKFEKYSKVPLKFMTQVSAAYLPYFCDSGNFDALRRNRYCLIFRQTNKRIDAVLFKNIKNRLKVINSIHRVIDNSGLNEDELVEILETIRTVKNVIEDCDFYIFELKKRGIENVFTQIIDTEKPVKFLQFDESRFELNRQFYERMGLDFDAVAEREEEFLKVSQIGKYAPQTMQGSNTTSHHLSEDQKLEDKCKFPLRRPPPLPGRMENTDPYGETSISPLQWNRFLRTAKLLPHDKIPSRIKFQRHMKDGQVEEAPPLEIVEIMCEDAIRKEEEDEDKYMNFDDEWLEKNLKELENLKIIDFEAAVDPLIDEPIGDSDDEYVLVKPTKSKKNIKVKKVNETTDESEEEIMKQLTKMVEIKREESVKNVKDENGIQESMKNLINIIAGRKSLSPKRQVSPNDGDPPEEDEIPMWIPSPKKLKIENAQTYLNSAPSSSKGAKIHLFSHQTKSEAQTRVSNSSKNPESDSNAVNSISISLSKTTFIPSTYIPIFSDDLTEPSPNLISQKSTEINEGSQKQLINNQISEQNSMDTSDEPPPSSSSKSPTIKQISHHSSVDSDIGFSRPPMIQQISQHNSMDSEERPGSSPLEFLYKEQPPVLERQVPFEENIISEVSSPARIPTPTPMIHEAEQEDISNSLSTSLETTLRVTESARKNTVNLPQDPDLQYPMPDFDSEPHLRSIFPYTAKLFDNQWDFKKNVSFKDIGYADKEFEQLFYLTPSVPGGPVTDRLKYLQEHFPEKFANILPIKHREKERAVNIVKEEEEGTPIIIERMRLKTIHIQPDVELLLNPDCCNPMRGRAKRLKEKSRKKKKKRTLDDEVLEDFS